MANSILSYFEPGRDVTGRAVSDLTAGRLAWYAAAPQGSDQIVHVTAERTEDGDRPAGLVCFDVTNGGSTRLTKTGVWPARASSEARRGQAAYAAANGTVTAESGDDDENVLVGTFVRNATAGSDAVVSLNLA